MADRVRRPRRLRRDRAAAPSSGSVLELNGHAAEPAEAPRPRPTWAWSQTIPLAVAPEAAAVATTHAAEAARPQEVRANGTPSWAWQADAPAVAPAVVFAQPLAVADPPAAPPPAAPAAVRAPGGRRLPVKRGTLIASPVIAAVAILAVLAGAGVLHTPFSSDGSGSISAIHASQAQGLNGLAPSTAAPPLAIAPAPAPAVIAPAHKTPVTGGGGAELPDGLLDHTTVSVPRVVHPAARPALPLPAPLAAQPGGAAADAAALTGSIGAPDSAPMTLGPVAPASATTTPRHHSASGGSAMAGCGDAADSACPAQQVHALTWEGSWALATVERGPVPDCVAAGAQASPPAAGACTQAIHAEMLLGDPALATVADAVSSSSLTSGCPVAVEGRSTIGDLSIGGVHVAGGPGALVPTSTPQPNTTIALAGGTVVLNEQRVDRNGRGLTVNAVHLLAPATLFSPFSLDMVIGHSHSAAVPQSGCAAAPAVAAGTPHDPPTLTPPATTEGVLPDVLQLRRVLRGLISL